MTDFIMNEYVFQKECELIAEEAFKETGGDIDSAHDYIHETIDGHEWVIYTYKSRMIFTEVDTDNGQDAVELKYCPDIDGAIAMTVYYEMLHRAEVHLLELERD